MLQGGDVVHTAPLPIFRPFHLPCGKGVLPGEVSARRCQGTSASLEGRSSTTCSVQGPARWLRVRPPFRKWALQNCQVPL